MARDLGPWRRVLGAKHASDMNEPLDPTTVLTEAACWGQLRQAVIGRLAVVVDGLPDVFPVNFVVDHGTVVFRTAEGTKLAAAIGRPVAFESDGLDLTTGEAWSVVLRGTAREVAQTTEVIDALTLPLFPWHRSPKPRIVRVEPEVVSGRRFTRVNDPVRMPVRRAAPE